MLKEVEKGVYVILKNEVVIGSIDIQQGLEQCDVTGTTVLEAFSKGGLKKLEKINLNKVVYLNTIQLDNEYRREGLGRKAILDMIQLQKEKGVEYLFLVPYLIDEEWKEVDSYGYMEHLELLYKSVGFEIFDISSRTYDNGKSIPIYFLKLIN